MNPCIVTNEASLHSAISQGEKHILVARSFFSPTSIKLPKDTILEGKSQENGTFPLISFDSDGIIVTQNNSIKNLNIHTPADQKAIFLHSTEKNLGDFYFENLTLNGQFSFITRKGTKNANIIAKNIDIISADTRHHPEQPQKYGVNVYQGAFTVYNFSADADSIITLNAENITIGRENAPVVGSGLFVSGFGDEGGKLFAKNITTGVVYSTGKLPFGVSNIITAGIFVVYGAEVESITHHENIVTYGVNDMVLDTWGTVHQWISEKDIISYGPSGVGFVNFGTVENFIVKGDVKTFGMGARGYNQYDGTLKNIEFKSITTFGDGSVGVQISKKIGNLIIYENIETFGEIGNSLVKGKNVELPAIPLSIKNGGEAEVIRVKGSIISHGENVTAYHQELEGKVHTLDVQGKITAKGKNSKDQIIEE